MHLGNSLRMVCRPTGTMAYLTPPSTAANVQCTSGDFVCRSLWVRSVRYPGGRCRSLSPAGRPTTKTLRLDRPGTAKRRAARWPTKIVPISAPSAGGHLHILSHRVGSESVSHTAGRASIDFRRSGGVRCDAIKNQTNARNIHYRALATYATFIMYRINTIRLFY